MISNHFQTNLDLHNFAIGHGKIIYFMITLEFLVLIPYDTAQRAHVLINEGFSSIWQIQ